MLAMTLKRVALAAAMVVALSTTTPVAAHAQTANDINRLNQAMQLCNSLGAAGPPECAQLRAQTGGIGMGGAVPGSGQLQMAYAQCIQRAGVNTAALQACAATVNGGVAAAGAGAYGQAPVDAMAVQNAYMACVNRAGGNTVAIQLCANQAQAAAAQMQANAGGYGQPVAPPPPPPPPADPFASVFGGK